MKKTYEKSDEVRQVGNEVIQKFNPNNLRSSFAKIEYLLVYPNINKKTVARCIKVNNSMNFLTGLNYIIEVSGELWDKIDVDVRENLLWHELLHAYPQTNDKTGEVDYKIRDHDIKDFAAIIDKHGIDWFKVIKLTTSSLYDLKPSEEDDIRL